MTSIADSNKEDYFHKSLMVHEIVTSIADL